MHLKTRRPLSDHTYIYALQCPLLSEIHYVGKSDRPYARLKEHTAWVRRWKKHAKIKRLFPDHRIPLPDPRSSAKGAWLWSLDKRRLAPPLIVLEQVSSGCHRYAERFWTERLIEAGHRPTNGERRSFDAREREERAMGEAIAKGRAIVEALPSQVVEPAS